MHFAQQLGYFVVFEYDDMSCIGLNSVTKDKKFQPIKNMKTHSYTFIFFRMINALSPNSNYLAGI